MTELDRHHRIIFLFGAFLGTVTSATIFVAVFALFGIWK
jgi:hypothetical protein